ncbi:class A beta-lactamase-related serine hydrolase [Brevibacillus centrosporus]|uniref:serine hydrolase n=1 Tax=Brevibacillus centrosporus TaxID=54910 RepID=UPI002E219331|nr:class A beta-lactamase-related serine hydrolase [Brevibacillus centrosporus]
MLSSLSTQIAQLVENAGGEWGIYLEDLQTGETLAFNEHKRFYAASVIKVPIMTAVFAEAYAGNIALEQKIKLRQEDLVGGAGVLQHMTPGTELTVQDIVTLMIIQSDNTATNILIDLVGTESIRAAMQKTGMTNSQFYNKLMVVPAELEGYNELTAADMGSHFRYLATGKVISYDSCLKMMAILKQQQHRDRIPFHFPDPDGDVIGMLPKWELANKIGSVTHITHDTGVLFVGPHAVTICALNKGLEQIPAAQTIAEIGRLVYNLYQRA